MEGKYSLIFMADNGKTARLRLGPALLRSLVALLALLPIVAGVSLWLNWKLYEDRRSVLAENAILRATVDTNAQTVARLSGLEQFLQKAAPEALGELVAVSDVPPAPDMEPEITIISDAGAANSADVSGTQTSMAPGQTSDIKPNASNGDAAAASSAVVSPASNSPVQTTSPTSEAPVPSAEPNANTNAASPAPNALAVTTPPTGVTPDATATVGSGETAPEILEPISDSVPQVAADNVDNGFARVENLVARRVGSRSLRISFDLFNAGQVPQLSGHTTFELIKSDGQSVALAAHGDTTYRINRLKKIVGNPTLPADVTDTTGANVRISIFADKELIYRITTPLQ